MSLIEQLLDGAEVEWKPLDKVCINIASGKSKQKSEEGLYPVYGSTGIIGRTNIKCFDYELILVARVGANAGYVHIAKGEYNVSDNTLIIFNDKSVQMKYLYYYLINIRLNRFAQGAGQPLITAKQLKKIIVPIPKLEIQKEIVRILDSFTELTAELTTELTARKKQYNYYRDKLLTFDEIEVEWKSLGEIAEYSKTRVSYEKVDEKNYVGVDNLLQNREGKVDSTKVPIKGNLTGYCMDDILIGNIRPYLKKIWLSDRDGGTNGDVLVVHITDNKITPRYLYQVLADDKFFEYNMQHAKGAKMPRGSKHKIMEYIIPIPSLETQEKIVSILDKFDTLTTSLSEGLPREILLRKKQYEYYRDLLLNFTKENIGA